MVSTGLVGSPINCQPKSLTYNGCVPQWDRTCLARKYLSVRIRPHPPFLKMSSKQHWVRSNAKKRQQLGMPAGTAQAQLRKLLLFSLLQELGRNVCCRCGNDIASADDLSIDHKRSWLDSEDPIGLFFDLANVGFSHLSCNIAAGRRERRFASTKERSEYHNKIRPTTRMGRAKPQ